MSWLPIPTTPLQVVLNFVNLDDSGSPTPHPLAGPGGLLTRTLLLQQVDDKSRPALQTLLTTPLQDLFDGFWNKLNTDPDPAKRPTALIQKSIRDAESRAYAFNVNVPAKGTLRAVAGNVSAGIRQKFPGQQPGHQLTLSYQLPGITSTFNVTTNSPFGSWADPRINLSFDGEYLVEIAVPEDPGVPLGIYTEFSTSNIQTSAGTFWSSIEIGLSNAFDALKKILSGTSVTGGGAPPGSTTPQSVPDILSQLSTAFMVAKKFGFTTLEVDITQNPLPFTAPGNTVELKLTNPQRQGPTISVEQGGTFGPAQLQVAPTQVHAGDHVQVKGSSFPLQRATTALIYAYYMLAQHVNVEFGQVGTANTPPTQTTKQDLDRNLSGVATLRGLKPATRFGIRCREYDVPGVIATKWGPWIYFKTASSDQSQIKLLDQAGGTVRATATATIDSEGTISAIIGVPSGTPPGTYIVQATIPDNAPVQNAITVIASNTPIPPSIFAHDWRGQNTTQPTVDSRPTTFYGLNWAPFDIDIYLDNAITGTKLGRTSGSPPTGAFQIALTFRDAGSSVGLHQVIAIQRATGYVAKCDVWYQGPPK